MSESDKLRDQAKKLRQQAAELEAKAEKVEEPIVKLQKKVAELEKEIAELKNRSYIQIWNTYPKDTFIPSSTPYWRFTPDIICDTEISKLSTTQGFSDTVTTNHLADFCSTQILANRL